jgi:Domain of Unknown Function with PDB structure (DUF3857)
VRPISSFHYLFRISALLFAIILCAWQAATAQQPPPVSVETAKPQADNKTADKNSEDKTPLNPAQIELLETRVRFEANGDSRKEVHARVHINSELGVRQFARLNFDYNRSFESIEIPMVRVTHPSGGTADILPSAITDNPNPAVVDAPAYQDVRVKSVRILGLSPGDTLEYHVTTTVTKPPLAPNFWLDHNFDRTGVVTEEHFQISLPASILASAPLIVVKNNPVKTQIESRLYPAPGCGMCSPPDYSQPIVTLLVHPKRANRQAKSTTPAPVAAPLPPEEPISPAEFGKIELLVKPSAANVVVEKTGGGSDALVNYSWTHSTSSPEDDSKKDSAEFDEIADIEIGTTWEWAQLSYQIYKTFSLPSKLPGEIVTRSRELTAQATTPRAKAESIYNFVSQKIRTVDLPLGTSGFIPRPSNEILSSGYATPEDKIYLLEALAKGANLAPAAVLIGPSKKIAALTTNPSTFTHIVAVLDDGWLDPSLEVAPFGALPASYRGSIGLFLGIDDGPIVDLPASSMLTEIPKDLPFRSSQKVELNASLNSDGKLTAKVHYSLRGDNELLLRVAFHQTAKDKWKELANLLAISDGFRGEVTSVNASDPYATREPFTVDYEISMPKFVDWSKKPVRIPALLPQVALPDPPAKPAVGAASSPIELGTPLEVETSMTLKLPPGTTARYPTGTSVDRDYATFSSQYGRGDSGITASRHINFILRQLPASRVFDYNAFLRAVQNDAAQDFTLERAENSSPNAKSATPATAPPKTSPSNPASSKP